MRPTAVININYDDLGRVDAGRRPARPLILAALLFAAALAGLDAQEAPAPAGTGARFGIDEAVAAAIERSASVVDARASVEAARLALELSAPWRSSRITARTDLAPATGIGATQSAAPELAWSLTASAPLFTGFSLDSSIAQDAFGAGATIKPLARSDSQADEALRKTIIQETESRRQAAIEARATYRRAWLATMNLGIAGKAVEVAETKAEMASLNAAAGVATQSELIDADSGRIDAMVALLDATDAADTALSDLSRLVGRTVVASELAEPDPGTGRKPVTKETWLATKAGLATLAIDLEAATKAARPVLPDLSFSGSLSQRLDLAGASPSWKVSATLSVDPDTLLRGKDRASSLSLERTRRKAAESKKDASEEYDSLVAKVASTRSALDAASRIGTTAQLSFDKNSYLAQSGTVSGSSLLGSELSLLSARYRVAKARADLGAALDLLDSDVAGSQAFPRAGS